MDFSSKEALSFAIAIMVACMILGAFGNFMSLSSKHMEKSTTKDDIYFQTEINEQLKGRKNPTIEVQPMHLKHKQTFTLNDLLNYAKATDSVQGDISSTLQVFGKVDINKRGIYTVKFTCQNDVGLKGSVIKNVIVD